MCGRGNPVQNGLGEFRTLGLFRVNASAEMDRMIPALLKEDLRNPDTAADSEQQRIRVRFLGMRRNDANVRQRMLERAGF